MQELLESLESGSGLWADGWRPEAHAMVLLRIGRYPEAIQAYREVLDRRPLASQDDRNLAHAHYNLACAYASWSLGVEDSAEAADLRGEALRQLTLAVVRGRWSDLGWMEEDRDLDPIRDSPGYRALVEHIRRENTPPGGR
jgi:tetratricopeptide (TPR) repeat protein